MPGCAEIKVTTPVIVGHRVTTVRRPTLWWMALCNLRLIREMTLPSIFSSTRHRLWGRIVVTEIGASVAKRNPNPLFSLSDRSIDAAENAATLKCLGGVGCCFLGAGQKISKNQRTARAVSGSQGPWQLTNWCRCHDGKQNLACPPITKE
jgi:hypothetical protein